MTTTELTETATATLPACPFRGLDPFTEKDRDYFVGREEDSLTISANVLTAPVTILYGPSGVGKSSILMAGVVPLLEVQNNVTTVLFRSWQESDLIPALNRTIAAAVWHRTGDSIETERGFDYCVASAVAVTKGVVAIVFDQFEEFLLYHDPGSSSGAQFDPQFARLVNRTNGPVKFLISIREDWVAKLDRFQHYIPNLLSNLIRLDHLDMAGARCATTKPIEQYNLVLKHLEPEAEPYVIEPELVEVVLDQVKTGSVTRPGEGSGKMAGDSSTEARIETAFLQMILSTLWSAENSRGSRTLRLTTLKELGGAQKIVRKYVDNFVLDLSADEQEVCVRIFGHLITPSGSKIAHSREDLREFAGDRAVYLESVLQFLTKNHILRRIDSPTEVVRYEIFHDVLALPILQWRTRYIASMRERQRARRGALQRLAVLSAILVLVIVGAAWMTIQHRLEDNIALATKMEHATAEGLLRDAQTFMENRNPIAAGRTLQNARENFRKLADESGLVAVDDLSRQLIDIGESVPSADAMPYYQAAMKGAVTPRRQVRAMLGMATVDIASNRLVPARQRVSKAVAVLTTISGSTGKSWSRIAQTYVAMNENPKALDAFRKAVARAPKGDRHLIADCQYAIGMLHDAMGARREAIDSLKSALEEQKLAGLVDEQARTAGALSRIFSAAPGDANEAKRYRTLAAQLAANAHDNKALLHSDEHGDSSSDR